MLALCKISIEPPLFFIAARLAQRRYNEAAHFMAYLRGMIRRQGGIARRPLAIDYW